MTHENPQAFPFQESSMGTAQPEYGMTLRDWFAGQALGEMLRRDTVARIAPEDVARISYLFADAMLAERERGQ